MTSLLFHELTGSIIEAGLEVQRELKDGHIEATYRNALMVALSERGIASKREQSVDVHFHGVCVGHFRMDLVVENLVVVECKTARAIDPAHTAQLLNYLHLSRFPVGFVFNFSKQLTFKRLAYSPTNPRSPRVSND